MTDDTDARDTEQYHGWNSTRFWAALAVSSGTMAWLVYHLAVTQGFEGASGTFIGLIGLLNLLITVLSMLVLSVRTVDKVQANDAWLAFALVSAIAAHAIDDYSISFPLSIAVVLFALIWSWRNR